MSMEKLLQTSSAFEIASECDPYNWSLGPGRWVGQVQLSKKAGVGVGLPQCLHSGLVQFSAG